MTVFGPMYGPQSPPYQGMTMLPKEQEEGLLQIPYPVLIEFLRSKTPVCGTDTVYSAVQLIAKAFTEADIRKFLKDPPKASAPAVQVARPQVAAAPVARPVRDKPAGNTHPQPIINAKVAAAKALGATISYSKAVRSWQIAYHDGVVHTWTAEFFREATISKIEQLIRDRK